VRTPRAAFTLLEVLAVVLLTALVIGVALDFTVDLSRASTRAADGTRELRRATAVLDRVARDLERTVLVRKPEETDPLDHPWIFLGEARGGGNAADHLKFVTRGRVPRGTARRESDLEVVAYAVRKAPDESLEVVRWSSPQLPEGLDREIPDDDERGAMLLASGLAGFGVTFIDGLGDRVGSWDSSTLVQSGELPAAVEVEIALADPDEPEAEPRTFRRTVVLPLRPFDLEELFNPLAAASGGTAEEEEEGDDDSEALACAEGPCADLTVCQAINCNADLAGVGNLESFGGESFCKYRNRIPVALRSAIVNPACR
jgi:type II secretory pathway component PulJ